MLDTNTKINNYDSKTKLDSSNKLSYVAQQRLLHFPLDNLQTLARLFLPNDKKVKITKAETSILNKRYEKLLADDIENVETGMYTKELLFQIPFASYLKTLPDLVLETFKMLDKLKNNKYNNLPKDVNTKDYPDYFQRNFHWQSDGYFSLNSARLYDLGVELLFLGTADIMRRQIIPPITKFLHNKNVKDVKMLDVACGTSRVLKQIDVTHPDLDITAIDLSPYYIEFAKKAFENKKNIEFITANAENLPFENESYDIISCVYLFHELPRSIRKIVLDEMYRVLKPGGILLIEDSIQLSESRDLENVIYRFAKEFHEPYYKDYVQNDIAKIVNESGFNIESVQTHYVAKVVIAKKY